MSLSKSNDKITVAGSLEASSELSKVLDVPGKRIKPCVAIMLKTAFVRGDFVDRSRAANIIASDLKILGKDAEYTMNVLLKWNENNIAPLSYSSLSSTVRTAYGHDYRYSCNNEYLQAFCPDPEMCPYGRSFGSQTSKYTNNRLFFKYRWPEILSNAEKSIYFLALIELERRRGVGAGGLILANHRDIASLAGIQSKYVGKRLLRLQDVGLIKYKPGVPRKWEGKASEIRRVIPIPKPPRELLAKLEREDK